MWDLTFRANYRAKIRIEISSWDEPKEHTNPRACRQYTGHHRATQEDARGRIVGPPLSDQRQLDGIESWMGDRRLGDLPSLRRRPPAFSRRAVGQRTSADAQSVPRQQGQAARWPE